MGRLLASDIGGREGVKFTNLHTRCGRKLTENNLRSRGLESERVGFKLAKVAKGRGVCEPPTCYTTVRTRARPIRPGRNLTLLKVQWRDVRLDDADTFRERDGASPHTLPLESQWLKIPQNDAEMPLVTCNFAHVSGHIPQGPQWSVSGSDEWQAHGQKNQQIDSDPLDLNSHFEQDRGHLSQEPQLFGSGRLSEHDARW